MERVVPNIRNGGAQLVIAETVIANTMLPLEFEIPVVLLGGKRIVILLEYNFVSIEGQPARYEITYENLKFSFKLVNFFDHSMARGTVESAKVILGGVNYEVHFMATAKFGNFTQFTLAMYKAGTNA